MEQDNKYIEPQEQEIDLLELAAKLWSARKRIITWGAIGAAAGIVIAFSIPKEYTTVIKLAPETIDTKSGAMSGLAAMAGINLGSGQGADAIYPTLYPDVVSSVPFSVGLFEVKVNTDEGERPITVREYIERDIRSPWWSAIIKLPGKILSLLKSSSDTQESKKTDTFRLTLDELDVVTALNERISATVDTKTSLITVSTTMQDPVVSAMLADTVASRLKDYVTRYRTEKARADLAYAQTLNDEARREYTRLQQTLAAYQDRNQGLVLKSAQTEMDRLQNEATLAFNLYNQTSQQFQTAKAKVQQTTPVFTVVTPATVPLRPSKPSKPLVMVGCIFLAMAGACVRELFLKDFKLPKPETQE